MIRWRSSPVRLVLYDRCPLEFLSLMLAARSVPRPSSPEHDEHTNESCDTKHTQGDADANAGFRTCAQPIIA
jgi:hypothetical protein